ncbi:BRCT domain-containing protein [Xylogone sp. PMI_703]|nr:BRCT domain-containing protein [Xylogone sp. PMI_703]
MAGDKGNPLFEHCVFAIVPSRDLSAQLATQLEQTLKNHAGTVKRAASDGTIDLSDLTHIISATSDFPQYPAARQHLIPVITPNWITQSLLKNKAAPMRPFNPDPNLIFSNVNISCADLPSGDKDAIIGAVLAMGGMESNSVSKQTTHICALTIDNDKCKEAMEKKLKAKIVLPHWFDDCLKLGKRIDEGPYLLPDPEIFSKTADESVQIPKTSTLEGATSPRPKYLPTPTDSPEKRCLDVFKGKKVMLSDDLGLGNRLRGIIEQLIEGGGGSMANSVHDANIYVCHYREGRDYTFACRDGKDVGNLSWLYHLITHNEWTSPLRRLLHYPLPKGGIPGFENCRITLSNYGGEARIYLENLVTAAGATFTKSMKQDNTHLVTARKSSEKCQAAAEWNIHMINHLWLEESYAKCQMQTLTNPRYTHFPPRTNLGEVVGQTQFDEEVLRSKYFSRDPTPRPNDPKRPRVAMHDRDHNAESARTSDTHDIGEAEELAADKVSHVKSKPLKASKPTQKRKSNSNDGTKPELMTPSVNRRVSAGKENNSPYTPSSANSRSAKDKAMSKLHNLAPDIELYEKEKKRGGQVWGGKRAANQLDRERSKDRSSSPPHVSNVKDEHYSEEEERTPKRIKTNRPPITIRLLLTGYKGWLNNPNKEDTDKKKLRDLGILITTDPHNCTHVAAPGIVRTQKFLCALATSPIVLSSDFVDKCITEGKLPDPNSYLLNDKENEKKFDMKLKESLARAKVNKRQLLRGTPIYCTAEVPNGPDTYKSIVEANGGLFYVYRARSGSTIKRINPEEDENGGEPVYLITGLRPEERKLWPKFEEMAKGGNMEARIVQPEWLLEVALSQELKWTTKYLAPKA